MPVLTTGFLLVSVSVSWTISQQPYNFLFPYATNRDLTQQDGLGSQDGGMATKSRARLGVRVAAGVIKTNLTQQNATTDVVI